MPRIVSELNEVSPLFDTVKGVKIMFFKKITSYEHACANWKNFALSLAVNILSSAVGTVLALVLCIALVWFIKSSGF